MQIVQQTDGQKQFLTLLAHTQGNWGKCERAPHIRVCCEFSIYIFTYLAHCAVNHLQFLFCIYQLCMGHVHILRDTRTCLYIKRSVYFSDQCWNRACYCALLWCPTPKSPQALLREASV